MRASSLSFGGADDAPKLLRLRFCCDLDEPGRFESARVRRPFRNSPCARVALIVGHRRRRRALGMAQTRGETLHNGFRNNPAIRIAAVECHQPLRHSAGQIGHLRKHEPAHQLCAAVDGQGRRCSPSSTAAPVRACRAPRVTIRAHVPAVFWLPADSWRDVQERRRRSCDQTVLDLRLALGPVRVLVAPV